jgi:Sec-independent protein translocase protein TatA
MTRIRRAMHSNAFTIAVMGVLSIGVIVTLILVVAAQSKAADAAKKAAAAAKTAADASKRATAVATEQARQAKQEAQRAQATAAAIDPVVCRLVYTYENLGQASPNGPQIAAVWRSVGVLVGCPNGTKP